jgi:hypothetical protein
MLDVHPPHERAHSLGDFLLHILTITIGLFIALSLESLVEWRHHVHLVHEARETLREEIEHNHDELTARFAVLAEERAELDKNLATVTAVQQHPTTASRSVSLDAHFNLSSLQDTAWRTAQSTGAVAFMPYAEAQRYADVYAEQAGLGAQQEEILADIARFNGLVHRYSSASNSPGLTLDAANAFAECFGVWRTHLVYLNLAAHSAAANDEALLQGKPAPRNLNEHLD